MYMASTKKYGYTVEGDAQIYTRRRQQEYKYSIQYEKEEKKVSPKVLYAIMLLVIILLFSSWFGMIFFKSVMSGVQMEINSINKDIRTLQQENSLLEAEKINALDIVSIQTAAENMGMALPTVYQVEYVDTEDNTANLKIID